MCAASLRVHVTQRRFDFFQVRQKLPELPIEHREIDTRRIAHGTEKFALQKITGCLSQPKSLRCQRHQYPFGVARFTTCDYQVSTDEPFDALAHGRFGHVQCFGKVCDVERLALCENLQEQKLTVGQRELSAQNSVGLTVHLVHEPIEGKTDPLFGHEISQLVNIRLVDTDRETRCWLSQLNEFGVVLVPVVFDAVGQNQHALGVKGLHGAGVV